MPGKLSIPPLIREIILRIWTDMPEQTVYTEIRHHIMLHLIRVYTMCSSCTSFLDAVVKF